MDWFANDMEEISFYTFTMDELALRSCIEQDVRLNPCTGDAASKPTPVDLARTRVRNAVKISGEKTKLGQRCNSQAGYWEATTQALATNAGGCFYGHDRR